MFDFQETINKAAQYEQERNYPLAAFHYWLIDFAYNDEEFPFSYTEEIGKKGRNGFLKMMKKHKNEILNSTEYLSFKEQFNIFKTYQMYFANLERVVNYIINRRH